LPLNSQVLLQESLLFLSQEMEKEEYSKSLSNFYLAGINYEKANTAVRSLFAIDGKAYERIARNNSLDNSPGCFIISTCNRTEIYGFAEDASHLVRLLCSETKGNAVEFLSNAYVLNGLEAIKHLFRVGCGLDSQILGDYEVSAQVKHAFHKAQDLNMLDAFTERLLNSTFQVSKRVKTETAISSGTVSVAFAVVQYLREVPDIENKNLLMLGLGKIGRSTCMNLMDYLGLKKITVINRTEEVANTFASEQGISYVPFDHLDVQLREADIVMVATNAPEPTLKVKDIRERNKIILDLSIPRNVSEDIKNIKGIRVIDVDELSRITEQTLEIRKDGIPKADKIIEEEMKEFQEWYKSRKHAIILKAVKEKMERISERAIKNQHKETQANVDDLEALSNTMIQKMLNVLAGKLRDSNGKADFYCRVLSEIFEVATVE